MQPLASSSISPKSLPPVATTSPSRMSTSPDRMPVASITVPPRIAISGIPLKGPLGPRRLPAFAGSGKLGPRSEQEEQHRHADGDTVGNLLGDHRVGKGGHLGGDLHA